MTAETSSTLLMQARDRGDHAAWSRLVSVYSPLLHAWVRRAGMAGGDADDVVQEVLLAVAREMPGFRYDRGKGSFRGWLRSILSNRVRHARRARGTPLASAASSGIDLDALEDPGSDLSAEWDAQHDRHVVARLLESVRHGFGDKVWAAFTRVVLDGERPADVAGCLGMSVEAVYQARSRGLSRLRREAAGLLD